MMTVKAGSPKWRNLSTRIKCAVDETGRNSVRPWTVPRIAAERRSTARQSSGALRAGTRRRRLLALRAQDDRNRRGDEDRRVGAGHDADEQRERETLQHLTAEQEQGDDGEER